VVSETERKRTEETGAPIQNTIVHRLRLNHKAGHLRFFGFEFPLLRKERRFLRNDRSLINFAALRPFAKRLLAHLELHTVVLKRLLPLLNPQQLLAKGRTVCFVVRFENRPDCRVEGLIPALEPALPGLLWPRRRHLILVTQHDEGVVEEVVENSKREVIGQKRDWEA
jgi:hypothetical protein